MSMKRLFFGSIAALACIVGISASALAADAASPAPNMCMSPGHAAVHLSSPPAALSLKQCFIPAGALSQLDDQIALNADPSLHVDDTILFLKVAIIGDEVGATRIASNETGLSKSTAPKYGIKHVASIGGDQILLGGPKAGPQQIASTWPEWSPPKLSLEGEGGMKAPIPPSIELARAPKCGPAKSDGGTAGSRSVDTTI